MESSVILLNNFEMEFKIKKIKKYLLLPLILFGLGCSSDKEGFNDDVAGDEIQEAKVEASFDYTISDEDPYAILLDNTTESEREYTAVWDFGKGGEKVADKAGLEEVRYTETGEYTITLEVSNAAGTSIAKKTIKVDQRYGVCPTSGCEDLSDKGLKEETNTFSVGVITQSYRINEGGSHTQVLKKEFNSLTAEFEMKMNIMYPSQDSYDFSAGDAIVDFAVANDMYVHGHALIWHEASPDWVENFTGSDAEFEKMVEDYITTTMTRYKGKVRSWDVVNEAVDESTGNPLRNSVFRQRMGDDYVKKCFQFARNADPEAILFYNDFNIASSSGKRAAIFDLVDHLGDLIDGLGAQMHISIDNPSAVDIQAVVDGAVSRGLKLHFSELDIRTNLENDKNLSSLSAEKAARQKAKFKEVVNIYNAVPPENKFGITVWGLRDNESWLVDFYGVPEWPLLFDGNYNKKQAYDGFLEGLR
ncbi:hypothetical protein B4Q04_07655 [Zobellia sp. OII3]|nr:hypothetical protein B4Q04_07655 [Zobellia sp. OII3]